MSLNGFWDKTQEMGGPITGSGPGFARAKRLYKARLAKQKEVGTWRKGPCEWKKNNGTYIDPDYYLVNYGADVY